MGLRTVQVQSSGLGALTTALIDVSSLLLTSATASELERLSLPNEIWCEIGLMHGGTTNSHKVTILAQGYIGPQQGASWSGRLFLSSETYLYAQITGLFQQQYKLAAHVLKPSDIREVLDALTG